MLLAALCPLFHSVSLSPGLVKLLALSNQQACASDLIVSLDDQGLKACAVWHV